VDGCETSDGQTTLRARRCSVKFVFFYSPIYEFYANHITESLCDHFELKPILINDLVNDKKLGGHTFMGGVSIKIELLIEEIKQNMGNHIVFSDATIFVNSKTTLPLKTFIHRHAIYDLCFADNAINELYNIGFMLIKCNDKTLQFFEDVLRDLKTFNGWDQEVVNQHIRERHHNLKITKFDKSKIVCGCNLPTPFKSTFFIFKSFIDHNANQAINLNKRLEMLKNLNLITSRQYNENVKDPKGKRNY